MKIKTLPLFGGILLFFSNNAFAKGLLVPFFPPLVKLTPVLVLIGALFVLWRLKRMSTKKNLWIVLVSIIACLSTIIVMLDLSDMFAARRLQERLGGYDAARYATHDARTFLAQYYAEHKKYPATPEELADKIPHISRSSILIDYRLLSPSLYEVRMRHEKWNDLEFMLRNDAGELFGRLTSEPATEFLPESELKDLITARVRPSDNFLSKYWHVLIGKTKIMKAAIVVHDRDTKKPIWGAHVILGFHKRMKDSERGQIDERRECKATVDGITDKDGGIDLVLSVDNCPTRGIESEGLFLTVKNQDYATFKREIRRNQINVDMERLGYSAANPPIKIDYPEYVIDIEKYGANFSLLKEMNSREIGDKTPIKSYLAWEYSHRESFGEAGFDQFLEKLECVSNVKSVPLLKEVLENKYPLPYKSFKSGDDPSWRVGDYVYEMGRKHVAKALLNVSDTRTDDLLQPSTDIPSQYVEVLEKYNARLTSNDYWTYLSGKYVSRGHNSMIGLPPSPDPLLLVKSKIHERLKGLQYAEGLFKMYQIATSNSADKVRKEQYNWQVDQKRLADDLFDLNLPKYTAEVKRMLPGMEANSTTRKYLSYLYKQREYAYLATTLRSNKTLMKAFLAEDVKETMTWNKMNETKYLGIEECLLPKMPRVATMIRNEIEGYLKETSVNYTYYRWWIRNLSMVNRRAADNILQEIYAKASIEPYKEHSKYEKQYALRGAAEGKLKGVCRTVYNDVLMKENLKRDYFSTAQERIYYLSSACPGEFNKIVKHFDAGKTKEQMARKNAFEPSYGYDLKDFRDSIWQGVEKHIPKQQAVKILGEYVCKNDEVMQGAYFGSNVLPKRYTIPCLCERIWQDWETLNDSTKIHLMKYLDKCYPAKAQVQDALRRIPRKQNVPERTYQVLSGIVMKKEKLNPNVPFDDERFHAFFVGAETEPQTSRKNTATWTAKLESDTALPILRTALSSADPNMVQAGLYALSFYSTMLPPDIVNTLKEKVSSGKYPESLYATYSLSISNTDDPATRATCTKAADYNLGLIEKRDLKRFDQGFAFNAVLTLGLCSQVKDEKTYLKLLNALFERNSVGRYRRFQYDIEKIVTSSSFSHDQLIEKLTKSSDVIDMILGIRLAELKKYQLDTVYLGEKLAHDDAYVRLASAKFIVANKEKYANMYNTLSQNTNRRVCELVKK